MAAKKKSSTETRKPGNELGSFLEAHDRIHLVTRRVYMTLKEMGDTWIYEGEMMRRARIAALDIATLREKFKGHVITPPRINGTSTKRVWAGTVRFATKLKASLSSEK